MLRVLLSLLLWVLLLLLGVLLLLRLLLLLLLGLLQALLLQGLLLSLLPLLLPSLLAAQPAAALCARPAGRRLERMRHKRGVSVPLAVGQHSRQRCLQLALCLAFGCRCVVLPFCSLFFHMLLLLRAL